MHLYLRREFMSGAKKSFLPLVIASTICAMSHPLPAFSSGFGIFTQGASALGQADAVVAHSAGPSTIFFNPALLTNVPGTQVEIGSTLLFPSREFSSDSGASASTRDSVYYPSTFYISHALNDRFSVGLGVFNPFGLGTEWGTSWDGRYITGASKASIETYTINPVLAWKPLPQLSIAAGLDVVFLSSTLENRINLSALGLPDAGQRFSGDGNGLGYNVGLAYTPYQGISFGASYRSEVEVDITGEVTFSRPAVPAPFDALLASALPNTSGKATIKLPQQVFAGIAVQPTDRLTVETGFRWEDWSSFKELKLALGTPVSGQSTLTSPRDWHGTFAVNLGGRYQLDDRYALLGGYLFGWNPVPDTTFDPVIPDSNTHLFCIGGEGNFDRLKIALSYAYQLQEDRSKRNTIGDPNDPPSSVSQANGTYRSNIHLAGISLTYAF